MQKKIFLMIVIGLLLNNATVMGMKRKNGNGFTSSCTNQSDRQIKRRKTGGRIPNIQDLMQAVTRGDATFVQFVLECHLINPNSRDSDGCTPLICAINLYNGPSKIDTDFRMGTLLLELGADPNYPDSNGNFPLHNAARNIDIKLIKELLKHGADSNITDNANRKAVDFIHEAVNLKLGDQIRRLLHTFGVISEDQKRLDQRRLDVLF